MKHHTPNFQIILPDSESKTIQEQVISFKRLCLKRLLDQADLSETQKQTIFSLFKEKGEK